MMKTFFAAGLPGILSAVFLLSTAQISPAGSATWNLNPTSGEWNTPGNWTPRTVPNGEHDIATFAVSNTTAINVSRPLNITLDRIAFAAGASEFTLTVPSGSLFLMGLGVVNDSGLVQNFVIHQLGAIRFFESSVAGPLITFTNLGDQIGNIGGGSTEFWDFTSAGTASFINEAGVVADGNGGTTNFHSTATAGTSNITNQGASLNIAAAGGETDFWESSTADQAVIVSEPGTISGAPGSYTRFLGTSRAGKATITAHGGTLTGTGPGQTIFFNSSNANRATLVADGGLDGTFGGVIFFADTSTGGLSVVRLFDHGRLDISLNTSGSVGVGSIEGNGYVLLGGNNLAVGRNNFSTSFSGKIRDGGVVGGTGGSLTKEGNGTLTLSCVGSYTGGTIINSGTLLLKRANTTGSGSVQVNGGTLAGDSMILGPVTIGTGTGAGAIIAPGGRGVTPATLTIANTLTLNADGSYAFAIDTNSITADQVVAAGVTIGGGATLTAAAVGTSAIPVGTVLTAISNTAATPITGTFSNLPDGGTIIAGNNIFQASYSGGDGNDLTLTVVP